MSWREAADFQFPGLSFECCKLSKQYQSECVSREL